MSLFRVFVATALSFSIVSSAFAQSASRTRLRSWPNPSVYNQPIVLLAEVDGLGGGAPKGMVSFFDGDVPLGSGALSPYTAGQGTIAAGAEHSCVLTKAGGAMCWGANRAGQLGDGWDWESDVPVPVRGLSSGVVAIAAGFLHTCALTSAGAVKCWGWDLYGQVGDGSGHDTKAPVDVVGLSSGVVAIAGGGKHTCAVTNAGVVKCWGANYAGQLGDGTMIGRDAPVAVSGLSKGVVAIAAGDMHSCALTGAGGVECWGSNYGGQLGDGTTTQRNTPVTVSGLASGVVSITVGYDFTCARTNAGDVKCWGKNSYGQLGDGTKTDRTTPVAVSGLPNRVRAIAAGGGHVCAVTNTGAVECWGRNYSGELGDGLGAYERTAPVAVTGLSSGIVAIATGYSHTCASSISGVVRCWGANGDGQLGDGTHAQHTTPMTVPTLKSLVRARAWLSIRTLRGGAHNLRARFPGDAFHAPSEGTLAQKVR